MRKRVIALLLTAAMLAGLLSGCGKKDGGSEFTRGDLLTMICDYFGMDTYQSAQPYLESVPADNPYFDVVQACVEWDIIGTDDQKYDVGGRVPRGELAIALVNAAVLVPDLDTATDEEKLASAAANGLVETTDQGKIKEKQKVDYAEAEASVRKAAEIWATKQFTEQREELDLKEGVQDLRETPAEVTDGQIRVPVSAGSIQPGDTFVYDGAEGLTAARAEYVREENGYYIITEDAGDDLELEDVVQELVVQESYAPDLSQAVFVDGAGNVHMPSGGSASGARAGKSAGGAHFLGGTSGAALQQTALGSGSIKFKVGDVTIEGKYSGNSVSIGFKAPVEKDKKGNQTSGLSGSLELSNIALTNDIDYRVFSGLKTLTTRLNYQVKVSGGASFTWVDKLYAPYNNGNGKFLTNLTRSEWRDASANGADRIKGKEIVIGSWSLVEGGIAQVKLELKLCFKITGEISASLTISGAQGIEYRNGNIRKIKTTSADADLQFKAKAELTAGPGIVLKILNKWKVLDLSAQLGAGLEASLTIHLVDGEMHQLESETTADGAAIGTLEANQNIEIRSSPDAVLNAALEYAAANNIEGTPKLNLPEGDIELFTKTCTEIKASWVGKLTFNPADFLKKLHISGFEINFFPKGTDTFLKYHVDNFDFLHPVQTCTNVFTPFEFYAEDVEEPAYASDAGTLDLKSYLLVFDGDNAPAQKLEMLWNPEIGKGADGELPPDCVWSSEDPSVATVDGEGNVTPVGVGLTYVSVALKDNPDVHVKCAVYVDMSDYSNSQWEFLPPDDSGGTV